MPMQSVSHYIGNIGHVAGLMLPKASQADPLAVTP
jgi:hypothetical protein